MAAVPQSPELTHFIHRLDEAIGDNCAEVCAQNVKHTLIEAIERGEAVVPECLLKPCETSYARNLMHVDPKGRYSVIVMVWDKNQGTPLHDHAGMWCVECVYSGKIRVQSYSILGNENDDVVKFEPETTVEAVVGEAGALIPPFDYHTIENALEEPSVTIHVYGGEMKWCHAFVPVDGGYRKVRKELVYTA